MSVTGSEELDRQLLELQTRTIRQAVRNGSNAGLQVISTAIVTRAPRGPSGDLGRSIGYRLIKGQPAGEMLGKVGGNVGQRTSRGRSGGKSRRAAPHAHLVTLGTVDRFTKRGAYRGRMPVNAFVSAGFAASSATAANRLIETVASALEPFE
jgi:hypothetical protein